MVSKSNTIPRTGHAMELRPLETGTPETRISLLLRMSDPHRRADAWNQFLERYASSIWSWCSHWGVNPSIEEDVLQETMLRVLNSIDFFERRRTGSFRRWLRELAHSSWLQLNRERERQLAERNASLRGMSVWDGLTSKEGHDQLIESFDAWATQELLELAEARVRDRVGQETWTTYEMLVVEHRSVAEVTEANGISTEQAYNRLFRVRRYLKQEYEALDAE